jgi:hypothetical protein
VRLLHVTIASMAGSKTSIADAPSNPTMGTNA